MPQHHKPQCFPLIHVNDLCTATGTLRNNLKYFSRDSLSVLSISGFWIWYNNLAFKGSTVLATTLWDVDSALGGMANMSRSMVNLSRGDGQLVQGDGQLVQGDDQWMVNLSRGMVNL